MSAYWQDYIRKIIYKKWIPTIYELILVKEIKLNFIWLITKKKKLWTFIDMIVFYDNELAIGYGNNFKENLSYSNPVTHRCQYYCWQLTMIQFLLLTTPYKWNYKEIGALLIYSKNNSVVEQWIIALSGEHYYFELWFFYLFWWFC